MESTINVKSDNFFYELNNLSTVNYLFLEVIISMIKKNKTKINIKDLSYQVLAEFWQLDLDTLEIDSDVRLLNEVRTLLMLKFGLTNVETVFAIINVLNYSDDRTINAKLFAAIKSSIKILCTPFNLVEQEKASYWKNTLKRTWKCDNVFYQQNANELIIDKAWSKYISPIYDDINDFIKVQLQGGFLIINNNVNNVAGKDNLIEEITKEDNFEILDKLENRMLFQVSLNKTEFSCLEAAFEYLKFTYEEYDKYKTVFLKYCKEHGFKKGANKYLNITTLLIIYTAIYRYNEEDSSGFWPEFFNDSNYSYNDVTTVMKSLEKISLKYKIQTVDRQYLEKINLSTIFSHIYIPDVSIRKIYSAIYTCYFRGIGNKRLFNLFEFYDRYSYKLDKPGSFFLMKDSVVEDSFDKIINLFNSHLSDQTNISKNRELPYRFIDAFTTWLRKEKLEIDSSKEEYYIDSPKISFDVPNEKIVLRFPNQKSRVYSDKDCGWKITIDNGEPKNLEARIIKQKEGSYLILDEEIKLNYYKHLEIEYIFNGRTERVWEFNNCDNFLIFDEKGRLDNKLIRQKCIIGFYKSSIKDKSLVIEEIAINGWKDYIFYFLNLENYPYTKIVYTDNQAEWRLEIEDYPSMKRSLFKLAFEKLGTDMIDNEQIPIYDKIGQYNIYSPNLNIYDFDVMLQGLDDVCKGDHHDVISINKESNNNNIVINFDEENMIRGIYYFTIRYKNRIFHREEFVLLDKIVMVDEFNMDYAVSSKLHRKFSIGKNNLFEITSTHVNTLVTSNEEYYLLEINNDVVAKFGMSINGRTIPVKKVILPMKWSIIGLENSFSNRSKIINKDISMNEFINSDPRFEIENYDYRYDILTYNLIINDNASDKSVTESKRLAYGYEFKLNFSDIKDRLIDFTNLTIKLQVLNNSELLYENILINIYDKIELLNCKINYDEGFLHINWEEKHENKSRIFKLYNYLTPWTQPYSMQLADDVKALVLNLKDKENGRYIPAIDFKKEFSLFDNINENYTFLNKTDLSNKITNKYGNKPSNEIRLLKKILDLYSRNRFDEAEELLMSNEENLIDVKKVFLTIIQMSYFIDKQNEDQISYFTNHTYKIINKLIKTANMEEVFDVLIDSKVEFLTNDFELILNIFLACTRNINYSDILIDNISEIDTINALCIIKNDSGAIPNNLKTKMKESFDYEVLSSARDYNRIIDMVANEIDIINKFWLWIGEHKNNYILKYDYSLPRAFRIYEYENEISTIKIDGNKLDDLVNDIKCEETHHNIRLPNRWSDKLGVKKEIFDSFKLLTDQHIDDSYKHLLECAFLSVVQNIQIKESDYFNMIIKMYFSNRWQLFNRYRAYFKLIFI